MSRSHGHKGRARPIFLAAAMLPFASGGAPPSAPLATEDEIVGSARPAVSHRPGSAPAGLDAYPGTAPLQVDSDEFALNGARMALWRRATTDAPEVVRDFYRAAFERAGLLVTVLRVPGGGWTVSGFTEGFEEQRLVSTTRLGEVTLVLLANLVFGHALKRSEIDELPALGAMGRVRMKGGSGDGTEVLVWWEPESDVDAVASRVFAALRARGWKAESAKGSVRGERFLGLSRESQRARVAVSPGEGEGASVVVSHSREPEP